jgi:phosphate transport system substrate-binding protein
MQRLIIVATVIVLICCGPEKAETPLRGNLHVLLPESAAPVLLRAVQSFTSIYGPKGAQLSYELVSSEEAIRRFIEDTTRCILTTRSLSATERQRLNEDGVELTEIILAYDAIAAVVHYKNPIERITTPELRSIVSGETRRWEHLTHADGMRGSIVPILDETSDVASFLLRRFTELRSFRPDLQRTRSNLATLQTVVADPASIGFVALDWVDSARVPVKMLEVAEPDPEADTTFRAPIESVGKFYPPHPAHIYRNYYPLKRGIYAYGKNARGTLTSGFLTFLANKEGQRIFLERNLVPATQPIRLKPVE